MLESIRAKTKSPYILLIFGVIILVFVFWGVGPGGGGRSGNAVATVNGEPIDVKEYLALHKRLTAYYRNMLKGNFTPAVEKSLNLKQSAIAILIDRRLAVMEAENTGVQVSKQEVQDTIGAMPAFQKQGVFDKDLYFKALGSERIKPEDFEKDVRRDLLVDKIRAGVIKDVTVNDDDVREAFIKENREINLKYAVITASDMMASVKVTDEEARQYLMEHSTDFVVPARVKAVYAHAAFDVFKKTSGISDKELKEYYDNNKDRFTVPEEVHARHILIRPDLKEGGDPASARKAAREKAEGILKEVKGGGDFAELSRKHSQDPGSARKGGDLGWFPRGVMMKAFEEAAFALKPGEVSEIVETPFGVHIIRLEGRKASVVKPFDKERENILKILAREKSGERAYSAVKGLVETFKTAEDVDGLKKAVNEADGVTFNETELFDAKNFDKRLAGIPQIKDSLFLMNSGGVSEPVKTYTGIYLVKVVERVDARIPEFEEVKEKAIEVVRRKKSLSAAKRESDALLKAVKDGKKLDDAAAEKGLKTAETGFFSLRGGTIPGLEVSAAAHRGVFDLNAEKSLYEKTVSSGEKFFVLEWKGSKETDISKLTPEIKESLSERLQAVKEEEKISEWISSLREKAEIQVFEDRM